MKYDWEAKVDFEEVIEFGDCVLPRNLKIVGLAVLHDDNVEACLILNEELIGDDVYHMDILGDIFGDAQENYADCYKKYSSKYREMAKAAKKRRKDNDNN
jgi:hypothetical protein|tara:strand:- start:275 stop:574 length:300 start_codon:yes stop_codon:yes gene_type:complete